jgi:glycosyltransferase involved in cell wall biosynthesis
MRLCLNMIVRDEAPVIERCIRSVLPHIQCWAIVDTGSSDGTQAIVRGLLGGLPGELIERPWVDFATNRNQALELARGYGDYALIMDADDALEGARAFVCGSAGARLRTGNHRQGIDLLARRRAQARRRLVVARRRARVPDLFAHG